MEELGGGFLATPVITKEAKSESGYLHIQSFPTHLLFQKISEGSFGY